MVPQHFQISPSVPCIMLTRSILSVAVCGLLLSPLLPITRASQEEDTGKQDKQFTVELDPETFDTAIAGGNVFVKFFAPW